MRTPEPKPSPHFVTTPADVGQLVKEAGKKKKRKESTELFSREQVVNIVQDAVQRREAELRSEYDRKLQCLLQEQFDNFTRFNQDYISRQFKRSSADYIS